MRAAQVMMELMKNGADICSFVSVKTPNVVRASRFCLRSDFMRSRQLFVVRTKYKRRLAVLGLGISTLKLR